MMRKNLVVLLIFALLAMAFTGCTNETGQKNNSPGTEGTNAAQEEQEEQVELLISAAASLNNVAEDLMKLYKNKAPHVKLTFTFASSGALQTQIEEGAPADIFMSAALKQMNALEEGGYILEDTKKELLVNKVVLIVPKGNPAQVGSFEDLATDKVKLVALGDPESVPVGQYSEEIFNSLGLLEEVKIKANYGTDVPQVLSWVESGEVDCGLVYATDAASSDEVEVISAAPENSHKPVIYPVAVLKASKNVDEAKKFVDFLSSPEAKVTFESYGFTMKE
jgi:molybdate transport system substrate-binding protein